MRFNARFSQRFKIDFIILGILLCIAVGVLLHHFPIKFSSDDDVAAAVMPQQLGQSGILLILPSENTHAQTYAEIDFSFGWYNLLSQVAGAFNIALTTGIQSSASLQVQLIVVPQKTAETLNETQIQLISQAVQRGANLIVEMPTPAWSSMTGIKRRTKVSSTIKHLTDAPNSPLSGVFRDQLLNTPLDTQVLRLDALDSETLPSDALLLELDGAIAHYRRQHGAGHVFVLAFNLGQAITSLQQGKPADQFQIETQELPKTSDLILNEKLGRSTVPYADLLKTHVMLSALHVSPMPLLWPFPDARRSALIIVHDTGRLEAQAFRMAEYEQSQEIQSTWLSRAGVVSSTALRQWYQAGFDMGVSILRPHAGKIYEPYGPPFFQPIAVERNMVNQKQTIARQIGANVSTCKMASSAWTRDYTLAFRKLAAAQCQIDLSYAPTEPEQAGYLFGSGFPFLPIERNGMPLPLYEFPTAMNDESGLETLPAKFSLKHVQEAENLYHQPVVVQFNADTMFTQPSYLIYETWLKLIQQARESQIWTTSAKNFMHYYTLRKQARLVHAFHPQTKVLDIKAEFPEAPFQYTVALPKRTQAGTLHDLWIDKAAVDVQSLKVSGDGLLILIPVSSGHHLVQAQYI